MNRRSAIQLIAFAALNNSMGLRAAAQTTHASSNDLNDYPFTEIDKSDWPKVSYEEGDILHIKLSEDEAKALIKYKINHHILDNKEIIENLKRKHDLDISRLDLMAAHVVMSHFADNVAQEFKEHDPWNTTPRSLRVNVENVMDKFWKRLSAHVQIDDIQIESKKARGKSLSHFSPHDRVLAGSMPSYIKVLGPPETWRGHVPFDAIHLNLDDNKAVENIARRRPQLNFLKIFRQLEIPLDILKVTADDLWAIGISKCDPRVDFIKSANHQPNLCPK